MECPYDNSNMKKEVYKNINSPDYIIVNTCPKCHLEIK